MPISEKDREFIQEVAAYFRKTKDAHNTTGSIRDTSSHFNINRNKVRKILITTGDITSPITEEAKKLKQQGMGVEAIAERLGISTATVSIYLPYDDKIKDSLDPGVHTQAVRDYRAYEREQAERQVQRKIDEDRKKGAAFMDTSWKDEWKKEIKMSYTETDTRPARMTWDNAEELRAKTDFSDVRDLVEEAQKKMALKEKADRAEIAKLQELTHPTDEQKQKLEKLMRKYGRYPGALYRRRIKDLEAISGERLPFEPRDVVRLHMELVDYYGDPIDEETVETLKEYGKVQYGETISRDVVVPTDIPLYAIHYLIQRLFGWQNSHLHKFEFSEETMLQLTENKAGTWADLVGIVFRSPLMDDEDEFWADDYNGGSFKNWMTKKYTGPYLSQCHGEGYVACKMDMGHYPENREKCYVLFNQYQNGEERAVAVSPVKGAREKPTADWLDGEKRIEVMCFEDVPVEAVQCSSERGCFDLLERLPLFSVLTAEPEDISGTEIINNLARYIINLERSGVDAPDVQVFPQAVTDTLYYSYDFGDGWKLKITVMEDCCDLVEQGRITQDQLDKAQIKCRELYRPVTLAVDGEMLLDDVGGIHGYAEFLRTINPELSEMSPEERASAKAEKKEMLDWARSVQSWKKLNPMI